MEAEIVTRMDSLADEHSKTHNTHTHLIVRGRDDTGKDLIIAGDYIADGFRHRAAELATEWLGPRTELEIQQTLRREVEQERWTSLDRTLKREAGDDGQVQIERFNEPRLHRQRLLLIGRLQRLQRLGLAITRAIAEAHGGGVTASSGQGHTCFTLVFPHHIAKPSS